MYCKKCEKKIEKSEAAFCPYCGSKLTYTDLTDAVIAAQTGSESAWEYLYLKTINYFRKIIWDQNHNLNNDQMETILQDLYVKIFKSINQLEDPKKFLSFGKTIAYRVTSDHFRYNKSVYETDLSTGEFDNQEALENFNEESVSEEFNPEAILAQSEIARLLHEIIDDLPELQRNCIFLWMDNYKSPQIAEVLNISAKAVRNNVFYAKKKIKTKVLELEKQGTKLYSMAPLTFFYWLVKQSDMFALSAAATAEDTALYGRILTQIHIDPKVTSSSLKDASGVHQGTVSDNTGALKGNAGAAKTVKSGFLATKAGKITLVSIITLTISGSVLGLRHLHHSSNDNSNSSSSSVAVQDEPNDVSKEEEPEIDYDALNENELNITLDDLDNAKDAPLGNDLKNAGIVRVAKDTVNDIYVYQYTRDAEDSTLYDSKYDYYTIIRVGNIFDISTAYGSNGVQCMGDTILEYGNLYYQDFDHDGKKEIAYITNDHSGYFDLKNNSDGPTTEAADSWFYPGDNAFTLPDWNNAEIANCCSRLTIIKGDFFDNQKAKWTYYDSTLTDLGTYIYNDVDDPEIVDGKISFSLLGQDYELPYIPSESKKNKNATSSDYSGFTWTYSLAEKYGGLQFYIENNKIYLKFPFMIADDPTFGASERIGCYFGLGNCEVLFDGSFTWQYQNVSFVELDRNTSTR